jgi:hypothetical protein
LISRELIRNSGVQKGADAFSPLAKHGEALPRFSYPFSDFLDVRTDYEVILSNSSDGAVQSNHVPDDTSW